MKSRSSVAGLSMSALAVVAWVTYEGWAPTATIPIPGDVPTHGFGTTTHVDGSPVRLGEPITPVQAVRRVVQAGDEYGRVLQRCFGPEVVLYQHEWDAFVLLAKNVGAAAVCRSSITQKVQSGRYAEACDTIMDFAGITRMVDGKKTRLSCAVRANGCYGVYRDKQALYKMCSDGSYPS